MQTVLDGFDEQIQKLLQIEKSTQAFVKKILNTQHIYGFSSIFESTDEYKRIEEKFNNKIEEVSNIAIYDYKKPDLHYVDFRLESNKLCPFQLVEN